MYIAFDVYNHLYICIHVSLLDPIIISLNLGTIRTTGFKVNPFGESTEN